MPNRVFKSFEEFAEVRLGKGRPPKPGDPLEKFYITGWWWTGEIVEYPKGPLPSTVFVGGILEAQESARKGWVPVQFVPDAVLELFLDYQDHKENGLPPALAEAFKERLAPKAAPPAPAPAPKPGK